MGATLWKQKFLRSQRKEIRERIERYQKSLEERKRVKAVLDYLPDFEIGTSWKWRVNYQEYSWDGPCLYFSFPWNSDEFDNVALRFQRMGWQVFGDITGGDTWMSLKMEHPELEEFKVELKQSAEQRPHQYSDDPWGQSCEVVVVGKEMREVDKLEVRCNGGVPSVTQTD